MLLEVRPGEGGEDAVLFAEELTSALCAHARRRGLDVQPISDRSKISTTLMPDPDKVIASMVGTHRIQRIPKSDKRGRRHTSTATVALVPDSGPGSVAVNEEDIEWYATRGSGKGGQHRNKTDSCVVMRHIPTGIEARVDSRSQEYSRSQALLELERRLQQRQDDKHAADVNDTRRSQIASGERPVKEFTWNEQRDEVIDHSGGRRWSMRKALRGRF